jgi:CubicO group peptidase (beta-lactamase class C family)
MYKWHSISLVSTSAVSGLLACIMLAGATSAPAQPPAYYVTAPAVDATAGADKWLRGIIDAVNKGDEAIASFVAANPNLTTGPGGAPNFLHHLLLLREKSGGYDLLEVRRSSDSEAVARVRNRLTQNVEQIFLAVDPSSPHGFRGFGTERIAGEKPAGFKDDRERVKAIAAYTKRLADAGLFSGVVLVAKDGKPIFERAYGLADRERHIPNKLDTRFRLGSLNKIFTGLAIGRLVEQGKLSYDDPLAKFIPDYPDAESAKKIRIKHLLSHTSGLGSFFPPLIHNAQKRGDVSAGMGVLERRPLEFEPGTKWSYSNTGILLLGRVIELVTGQNYFTYMEQTMLRPLGLSRTGFPEYDVGAPDLALPYDSVLSSNNKLEAAVPKMRTRWGGPAGDAASSARDLLRFANALEAGQVVSRDTLRIHSTRKPELGSPRYGYAMSFDAGERDVYGHGGGAPGTCSQLSIIRDMPAPYTVVVLGNKSGCREILDKILSSIAPVPH